MQAASPAPIGRVAEERLHHANILHLKRFEIPYPNQMLQSSALAQIPYHNQMLQSSALAQTSNGHQEGGALKDRQPPYHVQECTGLASWHSSVLQGLSGWQAQLKTGSSLVRGNSSIQKRYLEIHACTGHPVICCSDSELCALMRKFTNQ
jgi:hypothetical protein